MMNFRIVNDKQCIAYICGTMEEVEDVLVNALGMDFEEAEEVLNMKHPDYDFEIYVGEPERFQFTVISGKYDDEERGDDDVIESR